MPTHDAYISLRKSGNDLGVFFTWSQVAKEAESKFCDTFNYHYALERAGLYGLFALLSLYGVFLVVLIAATAGFPFFVSCWPQWAIAMLYFLNGVF